MPETLYLIDGHALAYRAYFALTRGADPSRWRTSAGEPTAGIYGFTSVLLKILEQENPDYLAVAFDTGKTFRDEFFPEYKGTREKMPDDLIPQIERIRQLVDAFNIPRLEREGYEADDVLGSIARTAVNHGLGVKIFTGDRDLLQLVADRVIVNLPGGTLANSRDYLAPDVKDYLGVRPDQVVDYKALVGDTSDNIPGVTGIGDKSAVTLLEKYDTLDGVYAHLADLSAGLRTKLENGRESAYLSQRLARIVTDLEIPLDLEHARPSSFDPAVIEALFRTLEFRSLLGRLQALEERYGHRPVAPLPASSGQLSLFIPSASPAPSGAAPAAGPVSGPTRWFVVDTPEKLADLAARLAQAPMVAFDTETTSTDQMTAELVGISLAVEEGEGFYIPVGHLPELGPQLPLSTVFEALRGPMTDPNIPKAGHNIKYDYIVLARHGLRVFPLAFDTMIAEWLTNPNSRNLGLKSLTWVRLDIQMTEIESLIGKGKTQITMAQAPIEPTASYAAADADMTLRLVPLLRKDLEQVKAYALFRDIEMPLVPVLAQMEMNGVLLDTPLLARMSSELEVRLAELSSQVYQSVGEEFNLNSTQQLSVALFDRLGLEPPDRSRRTASGHFSTSAEILEILRGKHPVVDRVLEYRELSKLKSTYLDALPLRRNPQTGRIHTSYNQTGSVTGRIASSDPNLQNIPIRTELGREVRKAFIAQPGWVLISVDYSQVELRIAAHMSGDQAMLDAFRQGLDIHTATAAAITNTPIDKVTRDQRRHAKAINFGLLYGMSPFGLTRTTDLTLAEAENFVATYFQRFPGIQGYLDGIKRQAAQKGYVETLLGRRRYFPGLQTAGNMAVRSREEREAINAPIQGTAADIMKIAMIHVPPALVEAGLSARLLLQVHDELVLECPQEELEQAARLVAGVMADAFKLDIPLLTEARYGPNWGEMLPVNPG